MDYVYGVWVYEKPADTGIKPVLWSLHKTQDGANKALKLTQKEGFTGKLPVKD